MRIETDGNKPKYKYDFPKDPAEMNFYLVRLCAALDCLLKIRNHKPDFMEARFEASYKQMLCLFTMLDDMENTIKEMRADKVLQCTKAEGVEAALELLPEFITEND